MILAGKSWIRTQGQAGVGKLSPACPPVAHGPFAAAAPAVWSWEQRSLSGAGTLHPPQAAASAGLPPAGQRLGPPAPHSCFSEDPGFSAAPLDHKCLAGRACAFLSLTPAKPSACQCSRQERTRAAAPAPALLPGCLTCSRPAPCQSSEPELFQDSCLRLGETLDCASNPR